LALIDIKNFDWRSLKKYLEPGAANDLNAFLEKMPQNAGQSVLIAAGIAWGAAGALGLFTAVQLQSLTTLRAELQDADALQPVVPEVRNIPVDASAVKTFAESAKNIYRGIEIKGQGSSITITAQNTSSFPEFREAIGHVQNGGQGWRVNVQRLCVGRECSNYHLGATLRISKIDVTSPAQF
jgi:hypothetical protein